MSTFPAVTRWRSLDALVSLAARLPGPTPDVDELERWFEAQLGRTADPAFARLFTRHLDLPGIVERDYLHRIVEAHGLRLLAGIRFYAQDVARPFVEAIAWTPLDDVAEQAGNIAEAVWDADTIERLRRAIAREWSAFAPTHLRVHRPEAFPEVDAGHALRGAVRPGPGNAAPLPPLPDGWTTDVSVHVAGVHDMRPDRGEVTLEPFADVADALALVEARFEALRRDDPKLARDVMPSDADTLAECAAADLLFAMRAGNATVGLIATLPDAIDWIVGDTVIEEVVALEHAGHGYAAAAQRALAARLARDGTGRRLIGTIDGANVASRRSALRAGRPVVSRYAFVPL